MYGILESSLHVTDVKPPNSFQIECSEETSLKTDYNIILALESHQ